MLDYIYPEEEQRFFTDRLYHLELLEWVPRFETRLRAAPGDRFYALAAAILVAVLNRVASM